MPDKMLIDATHPEETRVVVLRGNRVEEFDFESANRKQLRGNIYLAKVTRVEPSLQAAFVDYGGNRHGFLAFSEIHPDYYQIPVADRQALLAQEERDAKAADADADNRASGGGRGRGGRNRHRNSRSDRQRDPSRSEPVAADAADQPQPEISDETFAGLPHDQSAGETAPSEVAFGETVHGETALGEAALGGLPGEQPEVTAAPVSSDAPDNDAAPSAPEADGTAAAPAPALETAAEIAEAAAPIPTVEPISAASQAHAEAHESEAHESHDAQGRDQGSDVVAPAIDETAQGERYEEDHDHRVGTIAEGDEGPVADAAPADRQGDDHADDHAEEDHHEEEHVESVGGADALEEAQERTPRFRRNYKIQEVIKRRQVMLVQVVKEERGSKGAALTTYLSLAGRYSVLMPNTARGGGISRKITSGEDRSRLKEIAQELEVPEGMGVILRTAGASRTKTEVKRDFEYLLRLWETVRDLTLKSMAPKLVYEEGSLTKRSIRDLYSKDIEEIIVSGEAGYKEARDFMRMLMPSHAKNVKAYNDPQPLFTRYGIESQLDAMFQPTVQLRSGGYIVINQTEALVAIDVNSGRATREHHIEDTALKTNCEAADEVARQLRLRDLAGLIVIDFIDMDEGRNNRMVERRMKDALKHDRARIQVGRISHFGLLEMSRQRIRTSVLESSTEKCPVCGGLGHVRSVSSVALQLLRAIEDTLNKGATHNLIVRTRSEVALYVLNHKRAHLRALEERFRITITISADATVGAQVSYIVDRGEQMHTPDAAKAIAAAAPATPVTFEEDDFVEPEIEEDESEESIAAPSSVEEIESGEDGDENAAHADGERDNERDSGPRRRRRRGRGRGRGESREGSGREGSGREPRENASAEATAENAATHEDSNGASPAEDGAQPAHAEDATGSAEGGEDVRRRRRRGRRGGRRNRHREGDAAALNGQSGQDASAQENGGHDSGRDSGEDSGSDERDDNARPSTVVSSNGSGLGYGNGQTDRYVAAARGYVPPAVDQPIVDQHLVEQPLAAPAAAQPTADTTSAAAPQDPPRRRSTIREPAPVASAGTSPAPAQPLPSPVVVSTEPAEPAAPKRGWWGKRLLGDKS